MVVPQLVRGDGGLLGPVVLGLEDVLHEPLVAAGRREHAPHQVVVPVGVGKGVEGVVGVHPKLSAGDEDGARGAQGDVAGPVSHCAGAHGGGGVVPRAGAHLHLGGEPQLGGDVGLQGANRLIALKELGHLVLREAAQVQHLLGPALVLHVQQQHAAGVGVVGAVDPGEDVVDVVLGEHHLFDAGEVLRLVFPHPQHLGGGEAGEGDVGRPGGQLVLAHGLVEVVHLPGGAAVVPQDGRADHPVMLVQHHQAVHLPAGADARHLAGVKPLQELRHPLQDGAPPVLRVLLAPAGMGKFQGVLLGDHILHGPLLVHQQQLHRRGP